METEWLQTDWDSLQIDWNFSFEEPTIKFRTFVAASAISSREIVMGSPMGLVQVRFVSGEINQKEEGSARFQGRMLHLGSQQIRLLWLLVCCVLYFNRSD